MKKRFISILGVLCICITTIFCGTMQNTVYADSEMPLEAKAAILMDYGSGEVLFAENENDKLQVASIVKLMTVLLTLEEVENGSLTLDEKLVASEYASSMGGSQVFIDTGASYRVDKMLQSVIMASANDASVALAEHIAGSEKKFVKMMNDKAEELGMTNTVYENCTGLPSPMQHSTAKDTALLLSNVIDSEVYHKYSTMWMDELVHPSGRKTEIVNTNKLVKYYQGCDSGKTGFTDEAGYCLAASVKRDDMRLVSVVLGTKNAKARFNESVKLLNYGFANFSNELIVDNEKSLSLENVLKSETKTAEVFASENFFGLVKKGEEADFAVSYELNGKLVAPLKAGDVVGQVIVTKNGVVVKEIDLIVRQDIEQINFSQSMKKIIEMW